MTNFNKTKRLKAAFQLNCLCQCGWCQSNEQATEVLLYGQIFKVLNFWEPRTIELKVEEFLHVDGDFERQLHTAC